MRSISESVEGIMPLIDCPLDDEAAAEDVDACGMSCLELLAIYTI